MRQTSKNGSFAFTWMRFSFSGASAKFQKAINKILTSLLGNAVWVYLIDIFVMTVTFELYLRLLRKIFILARYACFMKPVSCNFCTREIKYLGVQITKVGIKAEKKRCFTSIYSAEK